MHRILILLMLATLAMGCPAKVEETAKTQALRQEHVKQMEELQAKRKETLAAIASMDLPALVSQMEEDARSGVEPFNSPAYREVTRQWSDQGGALRREIETRKTVSYLPLLALRKIDSRAYTSLAVELRLNALLTQLGRTKSYNKWGIPHLYWEDAAKALVELGSAAEPGLKGYLKDRSPAPVWGSEEVAEYEAYQYRRCDYALALVMEIRGQSTKELPVNPRERDALISEIQ
jgi:hypothetical protein